MKFVMTFKDGTTATTPDYLSFQDVIYSLNLLNDNKVIAFDDQNEKKLEDLLTVTISY